jgi:hypothetical protein
MAIFSLAFGIKPTVENAAFEVECPAPKDDFNINCSHYLPSTSRNKRSN